MLTATDKTTLSPDACQLQYIPEWTVTTTNTNDRQCINHSSSVLNMFCLFLFHIKHGNLLQPRQAWLRGDINLLHVVLNSSEWSRRNKQKLWCFWENGKAGVSPGRKAGLRFIDWSACSVFYIRRQKAILWGKKVSCRGFGVLRKHPNMKWDIFQKAYRCPVLTLCSETWL